MARVLIVYHSQEYGNTHCLGSQFKWNFLSRFCVSPLCDVSS